MEQPERVFVVVGVDPQWSNQDDPRPFVKVMDVYADPGAAWREADRLNSINADKGARYFMQQSSLHR